MKRAVNRGYSAAPLASAMLTLALSTPVAAQTLGETVATAVATNPRVAGIVDNRQTTDSELRRARGLYYPQVDVQADAGPEYSSNFFTSTSDNVRHLRQEYSATINQRLYDGGEADGTVEEQKARSRSSAFRVLETSEDVGLDAVEAHLDVLRVRHILKAADGNLAALRALEKRVEQRTQGGAGRSVEVAQALARIDQAESDRAETQGKLQEVEARYLNVVGRPPGTLAEVLVPMESLPHDLDASISLLETQNSTVQITDSDIAAAQARVKVADSRFLPTFNLEVSGSHNREVEGFPGTDNEGRALVVMKWNLYSGGADTANRDAAHGHYSETMTARLQALRKAEQDLRIAWADFDSARHRTESLTQEVRHNTEVHSGYDEQYTLGMRSLLDLLDSQQELFTAQTRLATVQEIGVFAAYRILTLDGMLLSSLSVQPPPESDPQKAARRPAPPAPSK